jgi:hypothetical protein
VTAMAIFTLEIDFDGTLHASAYRAKIAKAIDDCRQSLMSSAKTEGELKVPVAHQPDPVVIGRWRIQL